MENDGASVDIKDDTHKPHIQWHKIIKTIALAFCWICLVCTLNEYTCNFVVILHLLTIDKKAFHTLVKIDNY